MLTSLAKRGYFLGFYFWLDAIATLSLLFDIPAIMALLAPVGAGQTSGQGGTLTRAGRSANAGSKMGRILRLVRVIRVLRRIHKYERAMAAGASRAAMAKLVHPRNERSTRVGEKLSDLTTRCVRGCERRRGARADAHPPARPPQPRHRGRAHHPVRHAAVRCALLPRRRREQLRGAC